MIGKRFSNGDAALPQLFEQAPCLGGLGMLPAGLLSSSSRCFGLALPDERLYVQQGRF